MFNKDKFHEALNDAIRQYSEALIWQHIIRNRTWYAKKKLEELNDEYQKAFDTAMSRKAVISQLAKEIGGETYMDGFAELFAMMPEGFEINNEGDSTND